MSLVPLELGANVRAAAIGGEIHVATVGPEPEDIVGAAIWFAPGQSSMSTYDYLMLISIPWLICFVQGRATRGGVGSVPFNNFRGVKILVDGLCESTKLKGLLMVYLVALGPVYSQDGGASRQHVGLGV